MDSLKNKNIGIEYFVDNSTARQGEFIQQLEVKSPKESVIFQIGDYGISYLQEVKKLDIEPIAFCDNYKKANVKIDEGEYPIIDFDTVIEKYSNAYLLQGANFFIAEHLYQQSLIKFYKNKILLLDFFGDGPRLIQYGD